MSLVEVQYQQHFPQQQAETVSLPLVQQPQQHQQQKHPFLAAVSGNNYATSLRRPGKSKRRFQQQTRRYMQQQLQQQPYRQLVAAGSNNHGAYSSSGSEHSSPYTGYGPESTAGDYDYHQTQQMPSGPGYSSYQPSDGTGYSAHPPPPPPQPPVYHPHPSSPVYEQTYTVQKPVKAGGKKKKGNSALTALTLLSFFFFVNLLQSCLKEHMAAMNPTVMVMTVNGVRNRFNKLAEMNSREQNAAASSQSAANSVMEPMDVIAAAASSNNLHNIELQQSPYSDGKVPTHTPLTIQSAGHEAPSYNNNENNNNNNHHANKHHNYNHNNNDHNNQAHQQQVNHQHSNSQQSVRPEFYDSVHSYPNRNSSSSSSANFHHSMPLTTSTSLNVFSSYIRATSAADKFHSYDYTRPQQSSYWSPFYGDGDRRYIDDSYYTRIN